MCNPRLRRNSQWINVSDDRIVLFWSTHTDRECSSEPVPMFLLTEGNCTAFTIPEYIRDWPTREADGHPDVKMAVQSCQSTHSGPHGLIRASFDEPDVLHSSNRQCHRKSCSPRLQPVTSFTLIPNPDSYPKPDAFHAILTFYPLNSFPEL